MHTAYLHSYLPPCLPGYLSACPSRNQYIPEVVCSIHLSSTFSIVEPFATKACLLQKLQLFPHVQLFQCRWKCHLDSPEFADTWRRPKVSMCNLPSRLPAKTNFHTSANPSCFWRHTLRVLGGHTQEIWRNGGCQLHLRMSMLIWP